MGILCRWSIVNMSHLVDLAGKPTRLRAEQPDSAVSWHPTESVFIGTFQAAWGVPFAYHGDWGAPGRWQLEVNTRLRKLLFAPPKELQIQEHGRFTSDIFGLDNGLNCRYELDYHCQLSGSSRAMKTTCWH
jgi:hypothetical protein